MLQTCNNTVLRRRCPCNFLRQYHFNLCSTQSNCCPSVLDTIGLVIWPVKIVPSMTYHVFGETLNPTLLLLWSIQKVNTRDMALILLGQPVQRGTAADLLLQATLEGLNRATASLSSASFSWCIDSVKTATFFPSTHSSLRNLVTVQLSRKSMDHYDTVCQKHSMLIWATTITGLLLFESDEQRFSFRRVESPANYQWPSILQLQARVRQTDRQTDRSIVTHSTSYVEGRIIYQYLKLQTVVALLPDGSLRWRCSCSNWRLNSSIHSTSHWRSGSSLMARYSWTKACGCFDAWSSPSSLWHCCRWSPCFCSIRTSSLPMTPSWNRKSTMSAALTLSSTNCCSFLNLVFNTAFDSET